MSLVIEDGSIVPGANSYVTVAEADALLGLLNNADWLAMTLAEKEGNLAGGRLIVDDEAIYKYDGDRMAFDQPLVWPRTGASMWATGPSIPDGTITPQTKQAQIIAASGLASGEYSTGKPGEAGLVKTEKVDTLSVTYFSPKETGTDAAGAGDTGIYSDVGYSAVTGIVAPLLDHAYYLDQQASGEGVPPSVSARRAVSFTPPAYGGVWGVGMHDNPETS